MITKKELFKLIARNCHNDEATKDAVNKIFDRLNNDNSIEKKYCECSFPIIRGIGNEYCGICLNDLL